MLKIRNFIVTLYYSLYYIVAVIFNRNEIFHDLEFWNEQIGLNENLAMHLYRYPAFRTLFYYRLKEHKLLIAILKFFCPPMYGFEIHAKSIGSLIAYHPYSTYINCESIGEKFIIRNNTTIGNKNNDDNQLAIIGNNVEIGVNSVIIGKVVIGDNVIVGAGSVVIKNVESNKIVAGNPAHYLR